MSETDQVEFYIEVNAADATDEELDYITRQLLSELRETDVESAELPRGGPAPKGSKGDPITLGLIAVKSLPVAIPGVVGLIQAWVTRGQGRTVKFKGEGYEFEGPPEEFEKFLEHVNKGRKKK